MFDKGGMLRLPGNHGKAWKGKTESKLYFNLGIYGEPKAIRTGDKTYQTIARVRELEQLICDTGCFVHTYVDIFSTEEEFETMFDHSLWYKMRKKYGAEKAFPTIYEKVKPEVNPFELMHDQQFP